MDARIVQVFADWWRREAAETRGSLLAVALIQSALLLAVVLAGLVVFFGLQFVFFVLLVATGLGDVFAKYGFPAFVVVTCGIYLVIRNRDRGYLVAAPALSDAVRVPGALVGHTPETFDPGSHANRFKLAAQVVFAIPIAAERAWLAWREYLELRDAREAEVALVLAALFSRLQSRPFAELAEEVKCDWAHVLPRLAHLSGFQWFANRNDAIALSEDLRLRLVDELELNQVPFHVS